MATDTVLISLSRGGRVKKEPVEAEVFGQPALLAVHKSPENDGVSWSVSHIPTGWRLFWYSEEWRALGAAEEVGKMLADNLQWRSTQVVTIQTMAVFDGRATKAAMHEIFERWGKAATREEAENAS